MKRVQLPRSLMELSTGAERTSERIVRQIEVNQCCQLPECVGDGTYMKRVQLSRSLKLSTGAERSPVNLL